MTLLKLKQILEAALMASGDVLSVERLQLLFDDYDKPKSTDIKKALQCLMNEFSDRGIELVEVASGYRLQVRKEVAPWVTRLWDEKPPRYSRALLETLSLIAYRQPITRGDIEDVRGVAVSSHIIRTLLEREWVRIVGHRDVPGRPALFATTKDFLDYFNLKSLDELPTLDEIRDIKDTHDEVDLINSEKDASVHREFNFTSESDVEARGEEVLSETELELQEAERLMRQVEENVFNQPSEAELAAAREVERQDIESRSIESSSFANMADKTQQRLADSTKNDGPSIADLADKIADHQARLSSDSMLDSSRNERLQSKTEDENSLPLETLTLLQQQERLMKRLMEEEAGRQVPLQSQAVGASFDPSQSAFDDNGQSVGLDLSDDRRMSDDEEAELLAEALAEKERLAEEALENELDSGEFLNENSNKPPFV